MKDHYSPDLYDHERLALVSLPADGDWNLQLGPEVGLCVVVKDDAPVVDLWLGRVAVMARDLAVVRGLRVPAHDDHPVGLDTDDDRLVLFLVPGRELVQLPDADDTLADPTLSEHLSVLAHHADVVMVLGRIHPTVMGPRLSRVVIGTSHQHHVEGLRSF